MTPEYTEEQLKNRYTHHAPKGDQPMRYSEIRSAILAAARVINRNVPDSLEKELAFGYLDGAMMFANAGIARNE